MENDKTKKATEIIEEVCEEICEYYCKYLEKYMERYKDTDEAEWHMIKEKCDNCVLRRLC